RVERREEWQGLIIRRGRDVIGFAKTDTDAKQSSGRLPIVVNMDFKSSRIAEYRAGIGLESVSDATARNVSALNPGNVFRESVSSDPQEGSKKYKKHRESGDYKFSDLGFTKELVSPVAFFPVAIFSVIGALYLIGFGYSQIECGRWIGLLPF